MTDTITSKFGETFIKVSLKSLKRGDQFKRKPDALHSFLRMHYNRASSFGAASYCCIKDDDVYGGGIEISAKAFVYIDSTGPLNFASML